jgi:hypothetical protein
MLPFGLIPALTLCPNPNACPNGPAFVLWIGNIKKARQARKTIKGTKQRRKRGPQKVVRKGNKVDHHHGLVRMSPR